MLELAKTRYFDEWKQRHLFIQSGYRKWRILKKLHAICNELGITYIALTPNFKALERAIAAKVPQIAVFIGASSEFNKKNINKTTSESLDECEPMFERAKEEGMFIRAYISMAFTCPFQGHVSFEEVKYVCDRFIELGADEIDIGDTNGQADPKMVYERFSRLRDLYPDTTFVGHFHDTQKMALANVIAAMQAGIQSLIALLVVLVAARILQVQQEMFLRKNY